MFLSYENDKDRYQSCSKDIEVWFFFGYIAKICILQALVSILAIGLEKKIKNNVIFSHFWPSFPGCYMHYLDLFFVFLAFLKSGNDFLYPHHGRSTYLWTGEKNEKFQNFHFFLKIWKFPKFSKQIKIFILSPVHRYVLRSWWGYKKSFPDFKEAKKTS